MDDIGLQRAIYDSLSGNQRTGYVPKPTTYRSHSTGQPLRETRRVIHPTVGRRDTLLREGIKPVSSAANYQPARQSNPKYESPIKSSRSDYVRHNSMPATAHEWEDQEVKSSVPGWMEREPLTVAEQAKVSMVPTSPSQFCLESTQDSTACYLCTYTEGDEVIKASIYTLSLAVKLMTRGSELFFIVLDYKQRGREAGAFVSISMSGVSQTWRIERYNKGKRLSVYCESVDKTIKLNSFLYLKVVVRGNGSRVSLYNGGQQIFREIDVSQGGSHTPGDVGIGVFRAKATIKDWQMVPGMDISSSSTAAPSAPITTTKPTRTTTNTRNTSTKDKDNSNDEGHLISMIQRDIMSFSPNVKWESIAALDDAKRLLNEAVVLPLLLPEFFTGIREPWKGVLLFGPPGTGKTMLAKAVASGANTTFFNCSASTLVSKYHGESERLVKVLFQLARQHAPSTIFFDEIDALMSSRGSPTEHEASRRLKSELLSQIDGMNSGSKNGLLMVLATSNKPWDLDDAFRRRLEKRIYIPLPDYNARLIMFRNNVADITVTDDLDCQRLAHITDGYSGSDIHQVCRDACMMPMRRLVSSKSPAEIKHLKDNGRLESLPVCMEDFLSAVRNIRPSVSPNELRRYSQWMEEFGST